MTVTVVKTSGESSTQNAKMLGYYSSYAYPAASCSRSSLANAQARAGMMAAYSVVMGALASAGLDNRFSLKQTGPPMPTGKLAMYSAVTLEAPGHGGATFVTERGHLRPLSPNDAVFSIPPGFTQQQ
jgi:hypothetical protein